MHVDVLKTPVIVNPDIQISGYNLKVVVQDDKTSPISDAIVSLSSDVKIQVRRIFLWNLMYLFFSIVKVFL